MEGVIQQGTGKDLRDSRYRIAGKTGTARIAYDSEGYGGKDGMKRHQASFAGVFPADNPRYSAIVVLYTGETKDNFYGGTFAAPVFKRIADKIFVSHPEWADEVRPEHGKPMLADLIAGNAEKPSLSKIDTGVLPSMLGWNLKDALTLLENQGWVVSFSGSGRIVKQSLQAGTPIIKGGNIHIELK